MLKLSRQGRWWLGQNIVVNVGENIRHDSKQKFKITSKGLDVEYKRKEDSRIAQRSSARAARRMESPLWRWG